MPAKPDRVSTNILNGRFDKIHNRIWQNASASFRDQVPEYSSKGSLPRIGESLANNFGLWNEWIGELMNEIGLKLVRSATFYNYFSPLQKGEVTFGEIIEEIFVEEAELRDFSVEKAPARELRRSPAKVKAAFHTTNFEGQYAITTEWAYVRRAFQSEEGVIGLIDRIVASLANSFEMDDRDLYLYTLLNGVFSGKIRQEVITWDEDDLPQSARNLTKAVRSTARKMSNPSRKYNDYGVKTNSALEDMYIIVDAETEAEMDVEMLSTVFNIDRAEIVGRVIVIDSWDTIDHERFETIRAATDNMVEFTAEQNAYLEAGNIKAVMFDMNLFQVYLKMLNLSTTPNHNGMYTNHFLNIFKVYALSPFANAIALVTESATPSPETITFTVTEKSVNDDFTALSLEVNEDVSFTFDDNVESNVTQGVAVLPVGSVFVPNTVGTVALNVEHAEQTYTADVLDAAAAAVGDVVTFTVDGGE